LWTTKAADEKIKHILSNLSEELSRNRNPTMSLAGDDMVVKLELLRKITNNFSEAQKVGSGGYGDVYRVC
jgi:hypothetical protein